MSNSSKSVIALSALLVFAFGAGCWKPAEKAQVAKPTVSLPRLDILNPGLSTSTSADSILVSGTTDQPRVWLSGVPYEVKDGGFGQMMSVVDGVNVIPVTVGNSMATTTINISIEKIKLATSTVNDAVVTAETEIQPVVKTQATRTVTAKTEIKPVTKKVTAVPVTAPTQPATVFSSTEMSLGVVLLDGKAHLNWNRATSPFQTYVIVKSTTDPNVYFPKQFWVKAISDIDVRSWIDSAVTAKATTYYRVCKLQPDQAVVCGTTAKVVKP